MSGKNNKKENEEIKKGELSIEIDNLFPILKKWMYSERDIFLRELIANSHDAIKKLQNLTRFGEYDQTIEAQIIVEVDKEKGTLTVSDNGLGMTEDEISRYINQVAFSGVNDFVKKYMDKDEKDITIGFFGVGFYSSFMVSKEVEIQTSSYRNDSEPVKWNCEGTPSFKMEKGTRNKTGTDVILHIDDENSDLLDKNTVKNIIKKHCKFLPIPIKMDDELLNDPEPLWLKSPASVEEEDYQKFYRDLYNTYQNPHFWVHLNIDYPFDLKGILYFPKLGHEMETPQEQIKIYCNHMFVTDHSKELVPEFMTLLQGALDSPDIPLNISRSMLQRDSVVIKIGQLIVSQVAKELKGIHRDDQKRYEEIWKDIDPVVKYGCMQDEKFYKKMKDDLIFKTNQGGITTLKDYMDRNEEKNAELIFYSTDEIKQKSYLNLLKENDLEALIMDSVIDPHFIQFLEQAEGNIRFTRVDSDISRFIQKTNDEDAEIPGNKSNMPKSKKKTADEKEKIKELFKKYIENEGLNVEVEELKTDRIPGIIVIEELMRRFEDMSKLTKTQVFGYNPQHVLVINSRNQVIKNLLKLYRGRKKDREARMEALCRTVYDMALLGQGKLQGEKLTEFLDRTEEIMKKFSEL